MILSSRILTIPAYLPAQKLIVQCLLTNNPTIIAGAEEPATLSGFFHPFQAVGAFAMAADRGALSTVRLLSGSRRGSLEGYVERGPSLFL